MSAKDVKLPVWASLLLAAIVQPAFGQYGSYVISYDPGVIQAPSEVESPLYDDPSTALGLPDHLTGENGLNDGGFVFPNVLSPFSPPYEADEVVEIGPGGHLTLELTHFALTGAGLSLGVFTNAGLIGEYDSSFNLLGATNPAAAFGAEPAVLEVSVDGTDWVEVNGGAPISFDMPSNFYQNAGVFDPAPPAIPELADFHEPIAPSLNIFDGQTEVAVLAALGNSAGGYWLDLSGTGLAKVGYVRFSVPMSALPSEPYGPGDLDLVVFEFDAVTIATAAVGTPIVPEPATLTLVMLAALIPLSFRRRKRVPG